MAQIRDSNQTLLANIYRIVSSIPVPINAQRIVQCSQGNLDYDNLDFLVDCSSGELKESAAKRRDVVLLDLPQLLGEA